MTGCRDTRKHSQALNPLTEVPETDSFTYLREGRALDVLYGPELLRQLLSDLQGERLLLVLGQLLYGGCVVPQVDLSPDQQEGGLLAVVGDLGDPLRNKS